VGAGDFNVAIGVWLINAGNAPDRATNTAVPVAHACGWSKFFHGETGFF